MKTNTDPKVRTTREAMRYFLKLLRYDSERFEAQPKTIRKNWRVVKKNIREKNDS